MRFGVQMYGLNPLFLQDKVAFLERVEKAGVRYMEPLDSVLSPCDKRFAFVKYELEHK